MFDSPIAAKSLQFLCLLTLGSLFALTGLRQFFIEPLASSSSNVIWFILQVAPLLAVVPGIVRGKYLSYVLTALFSMLYFVHGVLAAAAPASRTFGFWEVGFAVALTAAAAFAAKHSAQLPHTSAAQKD